MTSLFKFFRVERPNVVSARSLRFRKTLEALADAELFLPDGLPEVEKLIHDASMKLIDADLKSHMPPP